MKLGLCISRRATVQSASAFLVGHVCGRRARPVDVPGLTHQGGVVVVKKLALVTLCVAALGSSAWAQDAKAVIASAKKALGDPTSITYSGSARDVAFQQCGANKAQMNCQ